MRGLSAFSAAAVSGLLFVGCVSARATADDAPKDAPKASAPAPDQPTPKDAPGTKVEAAEAVLKDKGFKKDDRTFLLDEVEAIEKYEKVKELHRDFLKAKLKFAGILDYDDTLAAMQLQGKNLQAEATALQNQINQANSGVNRRVRGMVNQQLAPYRQQETALRNQISQINQQVNTMKSKAPKPNERSAAQADYDTRRTALNDAVRELEPLVAPLMAQYHEMALDRAVIAALADLHHASKLNYKLGPSDELKEAAKLLKNLKLLPKHSKSISKASTAAKAK